MSSGQALRGGLLTVLLILAVIVAILWVFLPFAIFGTKEILRDILAELRRMNVALSAPPPKSGAQKISEYIAPDPDAGTTSQIRTEPKM